VTESGGVQRNIPELTGGASDHQVGVDLIDMNMAKREAKCRALVRKYYAGVPTREALMEEAVSGVLRPDHRLLDAGCGDTLALLKQYGPRASFAVGVDLVTPSHRPASEIVVTRGNLAALPFRDCSLDLVVSRSVVEHLEDPAAVFREFRRVLKRGGRLIFTTPNKYYYSSLVARIIPFSLKDSYMRWAFGEETYDHFPVFYRCNTRRALRRIARQAGLRLESSQAIRHFPYYFLFSPMLFRLGVLYDYAVTWLRLDSLQSNWLVVMTRP
jgi:SAM-dependent methyltransferase